MSDDDYDRDLFVMIATLAAALRAFADAVDAHHAPEANRAETWEGYRTAYKAANAALQRLRFRHGSVRLPDGLLTYRARDQVDTLILIPPGTLRAHADEWTRTAAGLSQP